MKAENQSSDVVIVGGGPAGLYAAFYAGLRDLSVQLFEAQPELGGKLNFYPEKIVWDIGALAPTKGITVKQNLMKQATLFDSQIYVNTKITQIEKNQTGFTLADSNGKVYHGKTILFAIGGGVVSPKTLEVAYPETLAKRIHYTYPAYENITNQRLLISGGGNAAVDYALQCKENAKSVAVCYRGTTLSAHEAQIKQLTNKEIPIYLAKEIVGMKEENNGMSVILSSADGSESLALEVDQLLVQHGHERDDSFLDELAFDLRRVEESYLDCQIPTCTSIPGMFAAGDIQYTAGKVNLLLGAFQDAACSINQIKKYLEPDSTKQAMVSSHNKKFAAFNQQLAGSEGSFLNFE